MDSNKDFWSCFLILWDPGNPPSFCKHVSSSLRSLSSSSRRSLSSCENMSETGDSTKSCDHAREHSASFMHANNHIPYTLVYDSRSTILVKISCLILDYFTPPACSMESSKLTSPLGNQQTEPCFAFVVSAVRLRGTCMTPLPSPCRRRPNGP